MTSGTMDKMKAGIQCRGMDIQEGKRARETRAHRTMRGGEENSGSEGAGHRTMRGGMSGCHPDATTKKIAGERETREQKKENRGIPRGTEHTKKTGRRCP